MKLRVKFIMMKTGLILALLGSIVGFPGALAAQTCAVDRLDLRGPWGQAQFQVELADTPAERSQGLMFRTEIAASRGMLFIYDRPGRPVFWMKNTLIPLDILFITPTGMVQHVHHMAQPHDLSPISGGSGIQSVLEIRGGLAGVMNITTGSMLRHPSIDAANAAWPCTAQD